MVHIMKTVLLSCTKMHTKCMCLVSVHPTTLTACCITFKTFFRFPIVWSLFGVGITENWEAMLQHTLTHSDNTYIVQSSHFRALPATTLLQKAHSWAELSQKIQNGDGTQDVSIGHNLMLALQALADVQVHTTTSPPLRLFFPCSPVILLSF